MTEQDRGQSVEDAIRPETADRYACRVTGFSDLLPDWILPPEGKQHMRNARKEALLAFRSIVDAAIERQESGPASPRTPQRVQID